jgi:hypothetical protein
MRVLLKFLRVLWQILKVFFCNLSEFSKHLISSHLISSTTKRHSSLSFLIFISKMQAIHFMLFIHHMLKKDVKRFWFVLVLVYTKEAKLYVNEIIQNQPFPLYYNRTPKKKCISQLYMKKSRDGQQYKLI